MSRKQIDVVGYEVILVAYCRADGEFIDVYRKGQEPPLPPPGTVYVQETMFVTDVVLNGKEAYTALAIEGPMKFLRGRVVTDPKEATILQIPPETWAVFKSLGASVIPSGETPTVIAVRRIDGVEIGIPLQDGDIPPPADAPEYAVGESPEEMAVADAKAYAEGVQDDLEDDDEDPND